MLSPPARLMIRGVESGRVRGVPPNRRLETQSDKFLVLGEVTGWTSELHAAGIALEHLEGPRQMAKVTKLQSRRGKRECRCVREAVALPPHRSLVEAARKTCGEERRPGMLVCLVELVDTRHE